MRWLPWIGREHHDEVIAAKDALICSLEAQNAVLAERLAEPVKVMVEFPKRLVPAKTADNISPAKEKVKKPRPLDEIDYSAIDPKNMAQMADLAIREFGKIPAPDILSRWYAQVRMQIIWSKRKRAEQANKTGSVGTIVVTEDGVPSILDKPQDPAASVPQNILDMIAAAERGQ